MKNIIKLMSLLVIGMASINATSQEDPLPVDAKTITIEIRRVELDGSGEVVWRDALSEDPLGDVSQVIDGADRLALATAAGTPIHKSSACRQEESVTLAFESKEEFNVYLDRLVPFESIFYNKVCSYKTSFGYASESPMSFDRIKESLNDKLKHNLSLGDVTISFIVKEWNEEFVSAALKRS